MSEKENHPDRIDDILRVQIGMRMGIRERWPAAAEGLSMGMSAPADVAEERSNRTVGHDVEAYEHSLADWIGISRSWA